MEIYLDKRAVRQIRLSAQDAIEEGDIETLREDVLEAFTEEQVEEIERRLEAAGAAFSTLSDDDLIEASAEALADDLLDEWSGDDTDELIELLDTQLGDIGVDLKFEKRGTVEPEGEEEAEDEATDYEEEEFDEDDDEGEEDEEEEEEGGEEGE